MKKNCEFKASRCDKCGEEVPNCKLSLHLNEKCLKNKIDCFICSTSLNLHEVKLHLELCKIQANVCKECFDTIDGNDHDTKCISKISNCNTCKMPELSNDLVLKRNHQCLDDKIVKSSFSNYLKSINVKHQICLLSISNKHEMKFNSFIARINEMCNEMNKREAEKGINLERDFLRKTDENSKRLNAMKIEKNQNIEKNTKRKHRITKKSRRKGNRNFKSEQNLSE